MIIGNRPKKSEAALDFAPYEVYAVGDAPYPMVTGYFDDDDHLDLAVANNGNGNCSVSILLGDGNGAFVMYKNYELEYGGGGEIHSIVTGDFNGDGDLDLVVSNLFLNTVSILLGNGNGTFDTQADYTAVNPTGIATGYFNDDDHLDLAVTNCCDENGVNGTSVSILLGTGTGAFQGSNVYDTGIAPIAVATGYFDDDDHLDLAVTYLGGGWDGGHNSYDGGGVSILLGTGTGAFGAHKDYPTEGSYPMSITTGDFNGDGHLDLATVNAGSSGSGRVSILPGTGTGTFGMYKNYDVGDTPRWVITGDFNGDGHLDLATANSGSHSVSILLGTGTGTETFGAQTSYPTGGDAPWSVIAGDFDGDGKPDLAAANHNSDNVSILLNKTIVAGNLIASGVKIQKTLTAVNRLVGDAYPTTANTTFNPYAVQNGDVIKVNLRITEVTETFSLTDTPLKIPNGPAGPEVGNSNIKCNPEGTHLDSVQKILADSGFIGPNGDIVWPSLSGTKTESYYCEITGGT